jgi:hypothetical protein
MWSVTIVGLNFFYLDSISTITITCFGRMLGPFFSLIYVDASVKKKSLLASTFYCIPLPSHPECLLLFSDPLSFTAAPPPLCSPSPVPLDLQLIHLLPTPLPSTPVDFVVSVRLLGSECCRPSVGSSPSWGLVWRFLSLSGGNQVVCRAWR